MMNTFPSLRKTVLIAAFSLFIVGNAYSNDSSSYADRGGYRGGYQGDRNIENRDINRDQPYDNGVYGGGYGGTVIYPQNPYYTPSNQQTFPGSADFNNTYERNQHPPN